MEINGRNYWDPMVQVKEIEVAVNRLPLNAALRPHFEFLLGVIDAFDRGEFGKIIPADDDAEEPSANDIEVYRELAELRV